MKTTGSAASTGPLRRTDEAEGLKTHISMALGGLLDRALDNRPESGHGSGACLDRPSRGRSSRAYTSELAKQVRRLITKPSPARLVLLRAAECVAGVPDTRPYACYYCENRFELASTRNRHMGRAHRKEMVCSELKREQPEVSTGPDFDHSWHEPSVTIWMPGKPVGDMGGDGDFLCSESKPSVTASSASVHSVVSDGRRETSDSAAADAGSDPSESHRSVAELDSVPGSSVDSPYVPARSHCRELRARKDAPAARVVGEHPPGATATGQLGCSDKSVGLKTHMSTALGGLLDRALNNRLEEGAGPGLDRPTPSRLREQAAPRPVPAPASTPAAPSRGRRRRVFDTELARRVRQQLTSRPTRTCLTRLRAAVGAGGKSGSPRYTCLYCATRFDRLVNLKWHLAQVHKNDIISSRSKQVEPEDHSDDASAGEDSNHGCHEPSPTTWTSRSPGRDPGGDGNFLCSESRPSAEGSSTPESTDESDGQAETDGVGVSGAGSSLSESTVESPHVPTCRRCCKLLAGKDASAPPVAEEHPDGTVTTDPAESTAPAGCGDQSVGLKSHISMALGGLLDRALSKRLENGDSPGGSAHLPGLDRPTSSRRHPTGSAPPCAATDAVSMSASHRYACFYCHSRFEHMLSRRWHTMFTHTKETIASKSKQAELEGDSDGASGSEDSDHSWREPSPTIWTSETPGGVVGGDGDFLCSDCGINFCTPREVLAHRETEHGRHELLPQESSSAQGGGRGRRTTACGRSALTSLPDEETVKWEVTAIPDEHTAQNCLDGRRGASQAEGGTRFPSVPSSPHVEDATELVEADLHVPVKQEIEAIFVNEETPFLHEMESPEGLDIARDPLSIEEEGDAVPDDPLPICDPQSIKREVPEDPVAASEFSVFIKEDPDLHLEVDATDNNEAATRGRASDITRTVTLTPTGLSVSEVGSPGDTVRDSSHPGGYHCRDDTSVSDATVSTGVTTTPISAFAGTVDSGGGATDTGCGESAAGSAADGTGDVQCSSNAGSSGTADTKPPFCYAELIAMAIAHSPNRRAKLTEIYAYITSRFPYFKPDKKGWQNSISYNLSLHRCFVKDPQEGIKHKGNYWMLDPKYEAMFENGNFRRHRRVEQSFCAGPGAATSPSVHFGSGAVYRPPDVHRRDHRQRDLNSPSVDPEWRVVATTSLFESSQLRVDATVERGVEDVGIGDTAVPLPSRPCNTRRAKLSEIYAYITSRFPYFDREQKPRKKSISDNLSLHRCFVKDPQEGSKHKDNYWTLDPKYEAMFENGNFRRHRRVEQSFCAGSGAATSPAVPCGSSAVYHPPAVHRRDHWQRDRDGPSGDSGRRGGAAVSPIGPLRLRFDASAERGVEDVGVGVTAVPPPSHPCNTRYEHRSTQISGGNDSASSEESNLQTKAHDEMVKEQEESKHFISYSVPTQGINSREDNSFCSADNMSMTDSNFSVFTCSSCLQNFSSKYSLIMHVFIHIDSVEPPSHVCRYCGEVFLTDVGLSKHLRRKGDDRTLIAHAFADVRKLI